MEYTVTAEVTISVYTKVEAESEKEALRIASERGEIEKHEWGYSDKNKFMWIADDYDGEPVNLEIDSC